MKRYNFYPEYGCGEVSEEAEGDYVEYSDVEKLIDIVWVLLDDSHTEYQNKCYANFLLTKLEN